MTPVTKRQHTIGDAGAGLMSADSPNGPFEAVFEDDGKTAFLYGLDSRRSLEAGDNPIIHVCHIYNVSTVGGGSEHTTEIRWANGANKVGFFIDGWCCAVIDFDQNVASSRTLDPDWDDNDPMLEGL